MESQIKIRATAEEISDWFFHSSAVSVRYMERIGNNFYKVIVRHKELPKPLNGIYKIPTVERLCAHEHT